MTTGAWVLLAAAAAFAVADWVAVARRHKAIEYVAKPGALLALVGVAATLDGVDSSVRAWFLAALVLSLAGDVFLMVDRFVPGLASFLLGHVAYVVGLHAAGVSTGRLVVGAGFVVVTGAVIGRRIVGGARSGEEPELAAPVAVYMLVISAMVASAVGTGEPLAIAGAVLFYGSDALIGWTRFVSPLSWAPVAIMVTYHLGQAGLVLSLPSLP